MDVNRFADDGIGCPKGQGNHEAIQPSGGYCLYRRNRPMMGMLEVANCSTPGSTVSRGPRGPSGVMMMVRPFLTCPAALSSRLRHAGKLTRVITYPKR